jgi:cell division protein FtsN
MPKYERDSYEPDDVRVFDGGADEEEDGGSHLPVVIVISLLVLAAFGGVVWLAYNNGVAHGRADVPAQTVAQNTANEPAATAPGNGEMPAKQIKVYQQPAGSDEDADQNSPAAAPMAKAPADHARSAEPMKATATPPTAMTTTAKAPLRIAEATPKPTPAKIVEAPKPATAPPAKLMPAKAAEKPVEKPVAKAAAAPAKTAAATSGVYVLQIGAYKSQSDAEAAWKAYQAKHVALLSGISSDVQKADLGDKGVWYRLRVGSFADKDAAAALCDRLKADGGACFPAK